jgi:alpha,alpha-trehalase
VWFSLAASVVIAPALPAGAPARSLPPAPEQLWEELFVDVQRAQLFEDQKTFADAVPLRPPAEILRQYRTRRTERGFDLRRFVQEAFAVPPEPSVVAERVRPPLEEHLEALWARLQRAPDREVPGSSLLPLPHPYIVPGGRFREVYYWDSYFTMLGLRESGRVALIESMIDNFAEELARYGVIPNGNRTYYLSRSQPPFFALMVELLAEIQGPAVYGRYRDALEREYAYWMDRGYPTGHAIVLPSGETVNRYFDRADRPRAEAFSNDEATARAASRSAPDVYRDLRSAAESGWDFSSRWLGDGETLAAIRTTEVVPIDLNCLLHQLETTLAHARRLSGDRAGADALESAAARRAETIRRRFWSAADGIFCDLDAKTGELRRPTLSLAGVFPLFAGIATAEQAHAVAAVVREKFLKPGGVVTTLRRTGQQWDAPNGWAPLQWIAVRGLDRGGDRELAREIAQRWLKLNRDVYQRTGRMMEKYNVEDTTLTARGGEYPSQDGFGWTNGVYLALRRWLADTGS